jgi:hypothetical protein
MAVLAAADEPVKTPGERARSDGNPTAVAVEFDVDVADIDDVAREQAATKSRRFCLYLAPGVVGILSIDFGGEPVAL